jgi:hypothetical protein
MDQGTVVVLGAVVAASSTAIVTGIAKIFSVYTIQGRIEQKIDDHIMDEKGKFAHIDLRFNEIELRLPNGEVKSILSKLARLERRLCPERRKDVKKPRRRSR